MQKIPTRDRLRQIPPERPGYCSAEPHKLRCAPSFPATSYRNDSSSTCCRSKANIAWLWTLPKGRAVCTCAAAGVCSGASAADLGTTAGLAGGGLHLWIRWLFIFRYRFLKCGAPGGGDPFPWLQLSLAAPLQQARHTQGTGKAKITCALTEGAAERSLLVLI